MKALNPVEFIRGMRGILKAKAELPESLADNPTLRVLLGRRSFRKFKQKNIPDDVMRVILEAGRLAPSGVNLQSWSFGIFDEADWKEVFGKPIPFHANRAVIVLADAYRLRTAFNEFPFKPLVEYTLSVMNASIAAYAMNIAAESCGVVSVMLSETGQAGFYDAAYLKEKLDLPEGVYPLTTIVFGYPQGKALGMPPKLPLKEIIFERKYKEPDARVMQDWIKQMMAGYRAMTVTSSFKSKIRQYKSKVDQAEQGLKEMIFYSPEEFE